MNLRLSESMGSEHPKQRGPQQYCRQNFSHTVFFSDITKRAVAMLRGEAQAPVFWRIDANGTYVDNCMAGWPAPGEIDNYSCGFECQDLSSRFHTTCMALANLGLDLTKTPEEFMRSDLSKLNRSQSTVMASLVTIGFLLPRTVKLENVGGCPAQELLAYLRKVRSEYIWFGHQTDAADYDSDSCRFRLSIIGTPARSFNETCLNNDSRYLYMLH
jgi:site-specific DNA-cytosine methylase